MTKQEMIEVLRTIEDELNNNSELSKVLGQMIAQNLQLTKYGSSNRKNSDDMKKLFCTAYGEKSDVGIGRATINILRRGVQIFAMQCIG